MFASTRQTAKPILRPLVVDQFLLFWPLRWKRLCVDCGRGNKGSFGSNGVSVRAFCVCECVCERGRKRVLVCERKKERPGGGVCVRVREGDNVCDTANVRLRGEGGC